MDNLLIEQVKEALVDVNVLIDNIRDDAKERSIKFGYEISPYRMQNTDGSYLLIPLLISKANLLKILYDWAMIQTQA